MFPRADPDLLVGIGATPGKRGGGSPKYFQFSGNPIKFFLKSALGPPLLSDQRGQCISDKKP